MSPEDLIERLAKLEARHEELYRAVEQDKLSLLRNDKEIGDECVRLDALLRGQDGRNGLVGRVSTLERRWSLVLWGAGLVVGGAIATGWRLLASLFPP